MFYTLSILKPENGILRSVVYGVNRLPEDECNVPGMSMSQV